MATANVIELETCLRECITYCEQNPNQEFVKHYAPQLKAVRSKWYEAVTDSSAYYLEWQTEVRQDRLAWKHLGAELRKTQNDLRKLNAIDYPSHTVYHWDEEILAANTNAMIDYLRKHADDIKIATDRADALARGLEGAQGEESQQVQALDDFRRHATFRANALGSLNATIGDFRRSMRRTLGKRDSVYQSIRWPITLAPDEPIL